MMFIKHVANVSITAKNVCIATYYTDYFIQFLVATLWLKAGE